MIQDLSGSWCIKGTGESTLFMDSPVSLMHHDPDRSWIPDPYPDHPKGTQPLVINFSILTSCRLDMSCLGILTFITANCNCTVFLMPRFITTIYGRLIYFNILRTTEKYELMDAYSQCIIDLEKNIH